VPDAEEINKCMKELRLRGVVRPTSGLLLNRIEVDDHAIRIIGHKSTLEQAIAGRIVASGGIRRCLPKWRVQEDSNS
jgi:hypothetical protein